MHEEHRILHRARFDWPAGEVAVECGCVSGAALDFAVGCGVAERGSADLVADAVNLLLARGALPRTLAVTLASDDSVVEDLLLGIERGCRAHAFTCIEAVRVPGAQAHVAIVARGVRQQVLRGLALGDVVYAVAAPGLQGVGVREAIVAFGGVLALDVSHPVLGCTPRQALLTPVKSYAGLAYDPMREGCWRALISLSNGGLLGSVRSALPFALGIELDLGAWTLPPLHAALLRLLGNDLARCAATFTLGIGMLFVTTQQHEPRVLAELQGWREPHARIGRVVESEGVRLVGTLRG